MTTAFILGNGQSRQSIKPAALKKYGVVYGCNALYRDFAPDCLVATDRPIAEKIQQSGYSATHRFYTRRPMIGLGAHQVPKKYHGFSSGPLATSIAAQDGHNKIYLIGFDMGPSLSQKFNNIYADTEFYKSSKDIPTYTGNWIKQIKTLTKDFPKINFVRVCGQTTADIPDLKSLLNLQHVSLETFLIEWPL